MRKRLICLALASPLAVVGLGSFPIGSINAADPPPAAENWTTAVEPKPLSPAVNRGLAWLAEHQLPGGGWGQGDESANMGGGAALKDVANVADTSIAALALIRSGSTPTSGPYKDAIVKAVKFVQSQVEASDADSLSVSKVNGTRVQQKLGPNIDTFLASILLAEVRGRMPGEESKRGADAALTKVIGKIQKHQKADGSFEGAGWAPVLAQAMCGKGINRASQMGCPVDQVVLDKAKNGAVLAFNAPAPEAAVGGRPTGIGEMAAMGGAMGRGDAGVALYSTAANLGVLQDSVNTADGKRAMLLARAERGKDAAERTEAKKELGKIAELESTQNAARAAVVARLDDKAFIAGFGSNGGEEFLSYMNIAETLVVKGGDDWKKWDSDMTENLKRIQNGDGSWSGHHCITGRTFCTSTALLVMLADRTPVPVKAKAEPSAPATASTDAKK